jgi:chorismate mutase
MKVRFPNLKEVRRQIDRFDRQLVSQILSRVTALAAELGANLRTVAATWRAKIAALIQAERRLHSGLSASSLNHESQDPPCPCPSPTLA